jgi:hypothetical protein
MRATQKTDMADPPSPSLGLTDGRQKMPQRGQDLACPRLEKDEFTTASKGEIRCASKCSLAAQILPPAAHARPEGPSAPPRTLKVAEGL